VKYPLFLSHFNEILILPTEFSKNTQIPNFMEIRPVGVALFHAYRQTDMTKLVAALLNFANAPKNVP